MSSIHARNTKNLPGIYDKQYLCKVYPRSTIFVHDTHDILYFSLASMIHSIYVCRGINETQYLCLVFLIHNIYLIFMIHNIYVSSPRYPLFMYSIHNTKYLFLVSMIRNIYRLASVDHLRYFVSE